MPESNRRRPRRTTTVDPAVDAYLAQESINAGRVVDMAIRQFAGPDALRKAAHEADVEDSEVVKL